MHGFISGLSILFCPIVFKPDLCIMKLSPFRVNSFIGGSLVSQGKWPGAFTALVLLISMGFTLPT